MKKSWPILILAAFCMIACHKPTKVKQESLQAIVGCWKSCEVRKFARPDSQLHLFSMRPDSTLCLSMIFELGPRSRIWTSNFDVTCEDGKIAWDYHQGILSRNKDTMIVTKTYREEKSIWRFVRDRAADSLLIKLKLYRRKEYVYEAPVERDDGWGCANLNAVGIEKAPIEKLIEQIKKGKHGDIHSLLIVKDNQLVLEEYFAASGKKQGPFITQIFRDRVHHLASTTKSVTSTLVGIAINQGFIKDVDEPIYKFLPAYSSLFNAAKKQIRIKDMLTMTPGFQWEQFQYSGYDPRNDGIAIWDCDDVVKYVLQKPLEAAPGEKFNYSNGVPTVLGVILKNAGGMEVNKFAEKYLFQPLGISRYLWTSYPDGSIETDGGLALRARDLAKIGQLFLNQGKWNDQQIFAPGWVKAATTERLKFGKFLKWGYGYSWMQFDSQVRDKVIHSYFVPGDGEQLLAVFPELNLVIVFTAGNYGTDPKGKYYSLLGQYVLPAMGNP